jgi:hypothetical protein
LSSRTKREIFIISVLPLSFPCPYVYHFQNFITTIVIPVPLRISFSKIHNHDCHSRESGNPGKPHQNLCISVKPRNGVRGYRISFVGARRAVPLRISFSKIHNHDCHSRERWNPGNPEQNPCISVKAPACNPGLANITLTFNPELVIQLYNRKILPANLQNVNNF